MIQLTSTLKTITAQVVETSVTVYNSYIQDYVHLDGQTQPTYGSNLSQRENALIFYPILSTNSLKKCKKISMDNLNLDIRPLFCFCFSVYVVVVFLFTKQFWAIETGGFMFDYDCLGQLTRILSIHQQINVSFEVN